MELRPHPTPQHTHIASGFFTIWITKKVFYHLDSILLSPSCLSQFDVFHEVSYRSWATSLNGTFPNRADLDPLGSCPQMASPFLCPQLVSACSVFGPLTASGSLGDPSRCCSPFACVFKGPKSGLAESAPVLQRPWAGGWPAEAWELRTLSEEFSRPSLLMQDLAGVIFHETLT